MLFVTVAALLLSTVDEARSLHLRRSQISGELTVYKTVTSWDEARQTCQDSGAVLASPVTETLQKELRTLFNNTFYFIGLDARFQHNTFVSVEGVRLDEMHLSDMYDRLDLDHGQCLSMNQHETRVVQCTSRMPYVCYNKNQTEHSKKEADDVSLNNTCITEGSDYSKKEADDVSLNNTCITEGYTYYDSTGNCYKMYNDFKNWYDASATCTLDHGHLLVIDDDEEAQLIKQMFGRHNAYHVGLRDESHGNNDWKSVTGKLRAEIYNVWSNGGPTGQYYCGAWVHTGYIDNRYCFDLKPFICEL